MAARRKLGIEGYDPHPPAFRFRRPLKARPSSGGVISDGMVDYIKDAEWWIARSERNVAAILRMFQRGDVACCLYERCGAMLDLGRTPCQYVIALQLVRIASEEWAIDLCLSEIGIYVEEVWDPHSKPPLP